jgi:hypothetical protein
LIFTLLIESFFGHFYIILSIEKQLFSRHPRKSVDKRSNISLDLEEIRAKIVLAGFSCHDPCAKAIFCDV